MALIAVILLGISFIIIIISIYFCHVLSHFNVLRLIIIIFYFYFFFIFILFIFFFLQKTTDQ